MKFVVTNEQITWYTRQFIETQIPAAGVPRKPLGVGYENAKLRGFLTPFSGLSSPKIVFLASLIAGCLEDS
jgi:hypothetical protein